MGQYLKHKRSSAVIDGTPKLPAASGLSYGEIAINFDAGYETISIKNANDEVVPFSSDNIINARIAASGLPLVSVVDNTKVLQVVNGALAETITVTDNIATFTARTFSAGDVIRVEGAISNDTLTF